MPNPKLPRIPPEHLPAQLREAHEQSMQLRGDATFFEVFGHHPELYRWYVDSFYGEVFHGGLVDRRTKELVRYRLSTLHGCRFCNQGNRVAAREAGITDAALDAIDDYESSDALSEADRAAIALAERQALTSEIEAMDDDLYRRLRAAFSDAQILELGLIIGILSGVARFLFAFDLVEKETSCPLHAGAVDGDIS